MAKLAVDTGIMEMPTPIRDADAGSARAANVYV